MFYTILKSQTMREQTCDKCHDFQRPGCLHRYMCSQKVCVLEIMSHEFGGLNPFASGIQKVLLSHITGLFSVKIRKKFLAIKNFSVNDTMSGQPNKRLIH